MTNQESNTETIILVPEILFQTEHITTSDNSSFETSELVRKAQVLIRLLQPEITVPSCLIRGENTYISDDNNTLFAKVAGFPLLTRSNKKGVEQLMVTIVPLCLLSDNKMTAEISLFPPPSGCPDLRKTNAESVLITHLVKANEKNSYQPHSVIIGTNSYNRGLYGYYPMIYNSVYQSGSYVTQTKVVLETSLYDVKTEKRIWSAQTESIDPVMTRKYYQQLIDLFLDDLKNKKLL